MNRNFIMFAGPERWEKATALHTVSDIEPEVRPFQLPDGLDSELPKSVNLQRGVLRLKKNRTIDLFNAPGEEPVDAVAGLCAGGGVGLIIVLNNRRPYPLRDLHFSLHTFADFIAQSTVGIAVTRLNHSDAYSLEDYHKELFEHELKAPVFEMDVNEYTDVITMVQSLIFSSLTNRSYATTE